MKGWTCDTGHFTMDAGRSTHTMDGWHRHGGGAGGASAEQERIDQIEAEDKVIMKVIRAFCRDH